MSTQSITYEELDTAIERLRGRYFPLTAAMIFKDIHNHREPDWQPNDIVRDACGVVYQLVFNRQWCTLGTSALYSHDFPKRPLRRLVEES